MLRKVLEDLQGRPLMAADGRVGTVEDVYFDDRWTVRYFVVHTEGPFIGQRLLMSPSFVNSEGITREGISVALTSEEARNAPAVAHDRPAFVGVPTDGASRPRDESALLSARELASYSVAARDGPIGYVLDFLVSDRAWSVTELVADTGDWLPGKPTLISPDAVDDIQWSERAVHIRLTREEVERSPRIH